MRSLMSNGRIPKRSTQSRSIPTPTLQEPLSAAQARQLILQHRGWEGMRVLGHLDLSGQPQLDQLPENLTCESLDISDCANLTRFPKGLHVTHWIEIAGSGLTSLPQGHGFRLRWRGVWLDDRWSFNLETLTGQDILDIENVELRRVMIERLGYETFVQQVGGLVRDRDRDLGGERQLIYIPFEDDEPLMLLKVTCPSTQHIHVLRVPPHMRNCHQAAAWIAGFDNPADYHPVIEA